MAIKVTFGTDPEHSRYVIEPADLDRRLTEIFEPIQQHAIESIERDLLSERPDGSTPRIYTLITNVANVAIDTAITKHVEDDPIPSQVAALDGKVTTLSSNLTDANTSIQEIPGILTKVNELEENQKTSLKVLESSGGDFKTEEGYNGAIIDEIAKPHKHGDIILFKKQISTKLYDTGILVNQTGSWKELKSSDTAYSANNIYFADDITITKTFGKYVVAEGSSTTLACKDKTFLEVFTDAFATGSGPIKTDPSLSVAFLDIAAKEVGTSLAAGNIGKIIIDIGKYETPDQATGVEFTEIGATVTCNDISVDCNLAASSASTNSNINIAISPSGSWTDNGYTYKITGTGKSTAGVIPKDSLNNANAAAQISAKDNHESTVSKTLFKGYRAWFWGRMDTATALDSTSIRDLGPQKSRTTIDGLSSETPGGKIVIAIPTAAGKAITKVLLASNSDQDITSDFKQQQETIKVSGANNYTEVDYDVWVYQPADRDSSEEYKITIGNKEA
jgi:hypothetical protein